MTDFRPTIGNQIDCIAREIKMRRQVYPGLVTRGKMRKPEADAQIAMMEAVLNTLIRVRDGQRHE